MERKTIENGRVITTVYGKNQKECEDEIEGAMWNEPQKEPEASESEKEKK